MSFRESEFELSLINKLIQQGWNPKKDIERFDNTEVIDWSLLKKKIVEINQVSDLMVEKALLEIRKINEASLLINNKKAWDILLEGIKVEDPDSGLTKSIFLISKNLKENQYDVISQFHISNKVKTRIPDIVLFINGIPVVVMELKSLLSNETMKDAFNQNESLKHFCPDLWTFNIMNFISNEETSYYGSTFASFKRMHLIKNMRTRDLQELVPFLFSYENLYNFLTTYSFFSRENNQLVKYMAAPHQIQAVKETINRLKTQNTKKGGVIWHTQGSGKSVTMVILTKKIIANFPKSTILVITDRNDLDNQLWSRFSNVENDYLRVKAEKIESRKDLVEKLDNKLYFGLYFSTIQKFAEESGVLTKRDDIFVIVDEAHRSQNNIDANIIKDDQEKKMIEKFGFAHYMRTAFPNACLIGFTGTPLMKADLRTTDIFGNYNHKYLMNDSVEDGTTVPINYEMRIVKINLDEVQLQELDKLQRNYAKSLDLTDLNSQNKMNSLLKSVSINQILEDDKLILTKAQDMLKHWEKRKAVLHGKSIIVASSRIAAYKYFLAIKKLRPDLIDKVILVMTESNKDTEEMREVIVPENKKLEVGQEFRKDNSKYRIAIVVDMWLTGFDVPDLDTMYIDKFIKWHNLMQAIARVNRTYESNYGLIKYNGLIVDYIGIWKYLAEALAQYTGNNTQFDFAIEDIEKAKQKLLDRIDLINDNYGFDLYSYYKLNENEKYNFIIKNFEKVLGFNLETKNNFIMEARDSKRLYKAAYSVLDEETLAIAKVIEIINSLLSNESVSNDEDLQNIKEEINDSIKKSIDTKTSEVFVSEGKLSKDITQVSEILMKEAEEIANVSPRVAIQMIKNAIKGEIKIMESSRPYYAKKISEKLRELLTKLQKTDDIENILNLMREIAKEATDINNKKPEFDNPQLEAFFEVLADDQVYFAQNASSEVLRRLAEEILDEIRKIGVEQFGHNPRVKSAIKKQLRILLKNKYNYPPKYLGGVSGILIDTITKQISLNKDYFKKEEKI